MPTQAYAKVLMSLNGGADTSGGITTVFGTTVQLKGESTIGWEHQKWEIIYFPVDFVTPAGWTLDVSTGFLYSTSIIPSLITLPANTTWGKWIFRLRVNQALSDGAARDDLTDTDGVEIVSPSLGLHDVGSYETDEFDSNWGGPLRGLQRDLRIIELGGVGSGGGPPTGAAGGDLSGNYPNPNVAKIRGAAVGTAAGGLATGAVLRVTGASTVDWGPLNLTSANAVTGALPVANIAPGVDPQVFVTTAGPVTAWVTAAGDWAGAVAANVVSRIRGAAVGTAAGALVTGRVLRVTGASTIDYGAVDLANASAVTGLLPVVNIAPGTANQYFVTNGAGTLPVWATAAGDWTGPVTANVVGRINGATVPAAGALTTGHVLQVSGVAALSYGFVANTNVAVGAAIAVTKLANGADGTVLTTVGTTPTWSVPPVSSVQFQNVADIAAMQALVVTTFLDGTHCWVRSVKRAYILDTNAQTPSADLDTYASATAGRIWMGAT